MSGSKHTDAKPINLALQGGGAHGAFTWGVLDAFLADGRVDIEAISGTSAGAMNAVVLGQALINAPPGPFSPALRDDARAALRRFWESVARAGGANPLTAGPMELLVSQWTGAEWGWGGVWMDIWSQIASPYDTNPLNLNPLRDLVNHLVDFEKVRACQRVQIYVCATQVETGRTRIFTRDVLTADHVMASACLPYMFQAVEIDGAPYWDGGYVANPPLFPFFYESQSRDIVVVQINPIERPGTPKTARAIMDRMREITFNSSLLREYRNINFVARLVHENRLDDERYREILVHRVDGGAAMADLTSRSRLSVSLAFFEDLFNRGQAAGAEWLDANFDAVGERSTLDLGAVLKNPDLGV